MPKKEDKEILIDQNPEEKIKPSTDLKPISDTDNSTIYNLKNISCLRIIQGSIIIFCLSVTVALIFSVFFGQPQITLHGSVITGDEYCSTVGTTVLRSMNGNAVDAMAASVLCLSVTRPDVISIAGCGAFYIHKRSLDMNHLIDAMCSTPTSGYTPNSKMNSVGVPGLIAGLHQMHSDYGTLQWSELFFGALNAADNGFKLHPDLIKSAFETKDNTFAKTISSWVNKNANKNYHPQSHLAKSLRLLADNGVDELYNGSLASAIEKELINEGVNWSPNADLHSYTIHRMENIIAKLAGFNIHSFPQPFIGSTIIASVLSNLDLLNNQRPLNSQNLVSGNTFEVSILYHRIVELTKFALGKTLSYTSASNPHIDLQNELFNMESRNRIINEVKDAHVLPPEKYGFAPNSQLLQNEIGDSLALSIESNDLVVGATILMGKTFGSGKIVSQTGILLNSALSLFDNQQLSPNNVATNSRPAVYSGPIFLETENRKCGHRFMMTSSGGLDGINTISQVVAVSLLHLSNLRCQSEHVIGPRHQIANLIPNTTTSAFQPAVDSCLPLQAALNMKKLSIMFQSQKTVNSSLPGAFSLFLEAGFDENVIEALKRIGHNIVISDTDKPFSGKFAALGWTKYDLHSASDPKMPNSLALF